MSNDNFVNIAPAPKQFSNNEMTVKLVLDIGEQMLMCGGEVHRVEETIMRICSAYGSIRTDIFCITSTIIVTSIWANGDIITQTRKVLSVERDFTKLEHLNALSRRICSEGLEVKEAQSELKKIVKMSKMPLWLALLGLLLIPGAFTIFFGGTFMDSVAAMISSLPIFFISRYVYNNKMNSVVYYIVCSFITGAIATALAHVGLAQNLDKTMIGCIMVVIPGLNFTTAIEDIIAGDTATGTLKLFESAVITCAIACGFAFSVYACGGMQLANDSNKEATALVQILTAMVGSYGYGIYLGQKQNKAFVTFFLGGAAWFVYLVVFGLFNTTFVSSLIVSVLATLCSQILARTWKAPATVFVFPMIISLVPGSALYYAISNLLLGNSEPVGGYLARALGTGLGLALGIVIVVAFVKTLSAISATIKSKR